MTVQDDVGLLALIAGGDRNAFEAFYRRHAPWLRLRLCYRCADDALIDDVVQETFLAVWTGAAASFRPRDTDATAWLWRIGSRRLIDALRRRTSRDRLGRLLARLRGRDESSAEEQVLIGSSTATSRRPAPASPRSYARSSGHRPRRPLHRRGRRAARHPAPAPSRPGRCAPAGNCGRSWHDLACCSTRTYAPTPPVPSPALVCGRWRRTWPRAVSAANGSPPPRPTTSGGRSTEAGPASTPPWTRPPGAGRTVADCGRACPTTPRGCSRRRRRCGCRGWSAVAVTAALTARSPVFTDPVVFLAVAPLLPLVASRCRSRPGIDPTYEIAVVAPIRSFRLLLLRCLAVLSATTAVSAVASLFLPDVRAARGRLVPAVARPDSAVAAASPRLGAGRPRSSSASAGRRGRRHLRRPAAVFTVAGQGGVVIVGGIAAVALARQRGPSTVPRPQPEEDGFRCLYVQAAGLALRYGRTTALADVDVHVAHRRHRLARPERRGQDHAAADPRDRPAGRRRDAAGPRPRPAHAARAARRPPPAGLPAAGARASTRRSPRSSSSTTSRSSRS